MINLKNLEFHLMNLRESNRCFNEVEKIGLVCSMNKLEEEIKKEVYLWGKIEGTENNYYIVYYLNHEKIVPQKIFYFATDDFEFRKIKRGNDAILKKMEKTRRGSFFVGVPNTLYSSGSIISSSLKEKRKKKGTAVGSNEFTNTDDNSNSDDKGEKENKYDSSASNSESKRKSKRKGNRKGKGKGKQPYNKQDSNSTYNSQTEEENTTEEENEDSGNDSEGDGGNSSESENEKEKENDEEEEEEGGEDSNSEENSENEYDSEKKSANGSNSGEEKDGEILRKKERKKKDKKRTKKESSLTDITEEERLSYTIRKIDNDISIMPYNSVKVTNSMEIQFANFTGLNILDALKLSSWVHLRYPKHLTIDSLSNCDTFFFNNFFDSIQSDNPKGIWNIKINTEMNKIYITNFLYPGFCFYHILNTPFFASLYIGNGLPNVDFAFQLPFL